MVLSVFLFLTRVTSNTKMIPRCFFCIFNIFQNVPSIEKKGVPANVKFLEELFTCPDNKTQFRDTTTTDFFTGAPVIYVSNN